MSEASGEEELTYRGGGGDTTAVLYRPADTSVPVPFVIDVHAGAWNSGDRYSGQRYDRKLMAAGIAVLAIDFRCGPDHQHPSAVVDIRASVRFARENLSALGIETSCFGLVGSSSGGHLALLAGLQPDLPEHGGTREASAAVDFVIGLWPVSNPLARYQYVMSRQSDDVAYFQPVRLAQSHRAYYRDQTQMQQASIQRILAEDEYQYLPPVLVVQPERDQNVPVFMSQTLVGAYQMAGGDVTYRLFPGMHHGFGQADIPEADDCADAMVSFIQRFG